MPLDCARPVFCFMGGVFVSAVPVELPRLNVVGIEALVAVFDVVAEGIRPCPTGGVPTVDMRLAGGTPLEPSTDARADLAVAGALVAEALMFVRILLPSVGPLMVVSGVSAVPGDAFDGILKLDGAAVMESLNDVPPSDRREDGRETVAGVLKTEESRRFVMVLVGAGVAPAVPLTPSFRFI